MKATVEGCLDLLSERQLVPVSATAWLAGLLSSPQAYQRLALTLGTSHRSEAAAWLDMTSARGFGVLLGIATGELENDDHLDISELSHLLGLGAAVASCGVSGAPLLGLEPVDLRRELRESREALSAAVGYEVRALMPRPNRLGIAFDRFTLSEARKAGYSIFLRPGTRPARLDGSAADEVLPQRWIYPADEPDDLDSWINSPDWKRPAQRLGTALRWAKNALETSGKIR